eukprot:scaffold547_cov87-Skeletonema_dohrnii-CCMP3373.AAC.5
MPRLSNSVASQQEGQKGKRASHPFVFVWTGRCTGTAETQQKEGDEDVDVGCTTAYIGGHVQIGSSLVAGACIICVSNMGTSQAQQGRGK